MFINKFKKLIVNYITYGQSEQKKVSAHYSIWSQR